MTLSYYNCIKFCKPT